MSPAMPPVGLNEKNEESYTANCAEDLRQAVDIEVAIAPHCRSKLAITSEVEALVRELKWFRNGWPCAKGNSVEGVTKMVVYRDTSEIESMEMIGNSPVLVHLYKLATEDASEERISTDNDDAQQDCVGSHHWVLPHKQFSELWEQLVFDSSVKLDLLGYIWKTLFLSDHNLCADSNRLILLHGPPGTGKTTLCKALAHKISIRMSDRFTDGGQLVEINSHSLFSKWFSESGKLVQKMFTGIEEMAKNSNSLVIVLIDEVESLTSARNSMGSEPSDALRVVNAVLTQLDRLKGFEIRSNLFESLDEAFVSRADLKFHLGLPPHPVIYEILRSKIETFVVKGVVDANSGPLQPLKVIEADKENLHTNNQSRKLLSVSKKCVGLAGRSLQKLPISAYPYKVKKICLDPFLDRIGEAAIAELASLQKNVRSEDAVVNGH